MTAEIDLETSYEHCVQSAKLHAANFYHGFRLLPRDKRRALCTVYAFMRLCDDLADEAGGDVGPAILLERWRSFLKSAYAGKTSGHPILPALHDVVVRYEIPRALFEELLDGIAMDLTPRTFETFGDLERYCYLVAGVVGLVCLHIWGVTDWTRARDLAIQCGTAFQLTNILRDVREDALRGRVYLPAEDLERFGIRSEDILALHSLPHFGQLVAYEADRAEEYYRACAPLVYLLMPDSMATFLAMKEVYHELLETVRREADLVLLERVSVPTAVKLAAVLRAVVKARFIALAQSHG